MSSDDAAQRRLEVALLALPESTASTLYGMYDLFASVGRDWHLLTAGEQRVSATQTHIVAAQGQAYRAANGAWIVPDRVLKGAERYDLICIPDLLIAPEQPLNGRYLEEIAWLRQQYAQGATLATACSGALLLAEAGLLDGHEATTHWGYCTALSTRYPDVQVRAKQTLVISGSEQRLIMAGGGTTWQDLALLIIARFFSVEEAMQIARLYLIDWHDIGQQPFAALACRRQVEDAGIARCQAWITQNYATDAPVAHMAQLSGMAERSFKRRFAQATGMAPLEYVHAIRMEAAKYLLENTEQAVEAIAHEIGYQDTSFFGRLFRRKVGMTPAQYRRRFGSLRKTLETAGRGQGNSRAMPPA